MSAGSSLLGGILGHNAANSAGEAQQAAANKASQMQGAAGQQAQDYLTGRIAQEGQNVQPYLGLGSTAANSLNNALSPGGSLTQGWNQTFSAPTAEQAANTPGYQFQLQQGLNALQNSAAARGGLLSTGTAKSLNNYAQGTAASNYQQAYNNALGTYQTNFGTFEQGQNDLYNRLYGAAGLGANSAANLNGVQQAGTNAVAGNLFNTAQLQGQDLMGGASARAAGQVGGMNALIGGIGSAGSALGQGISSLLGGQNASNPQSNNQPYFNPYES